MYVLFPEPQVILYANIISDHIWMKRKHTSDGAESTIALKKSSVHLEKINYKNTEEIQNGKSFIKLQN